MNLLSHKFTPDVCHDKFRKLSSLFPPLYLCYISTNHVIRGTRLLYRYKSDRPNNLIRLLLFFVASSSKQNTIMRRCARISNSLRIVGNTALQALELTAQIKRLTNGQIINNIRSMCDDATFHTSKTCLS